MVQTEGSADWSASYAHYVMRSAQRSVRALDLYSSVLRRVAQGELSPATVRDLLSALSESRGAAYSARLTELSACFFAGLVQVAGHASHPPPAFDAADPMAWLRRLVEYANEVNHRAVRDYQAEVERAAAGRADAPETQGAFSNFYAARATEQIRDLGRLYFDMLQGATDLGADFQEELLRAVLAAPHPSVADAPVLHLAGPSGERAALSLTIENTRDEPAAIRCQVTDVRRADGVGPAFVPAIQIDPGDLVLGPNEETTLVVSLVLDRETYQPDVVYVAGLRISREGEPRLEIPLRITATTAEPRQEASAATAPQAPPAAVEGAR